MGWFSKDSIQAELQEALISHENTKEKLAKSQAKVGVLKEEIADKKRKIDELTKALEGKKYDRLYSLAPGEQGNLLKRLINRHQTDQQVSFENLACQGIYLADRHSTIYELVHRIILENAAIKNSHFENACIDNVTFRNVEFTNSSFYKAFFEEVRFVNCVFKDCDFTSTRGYNVTFENCIQQNTDLSVMEIKNAEVQKENDSEVDELDLEDEELEI